MRFRMTEARTLYSTGCRGNRPEIGRIGRIVLFVNQDRQASFPATGYGWSFPALNNDLVQNCPQNRASLEHYIVDLIKGAAAWSRFRLRYCFRYLFVSWRRTIEWMNRIRKFQDPIRKNREIPFCKFSEHRLEIFNTGFQCEFWKNVFSWLEQFLTCFPKVLTKLCIYIFRFLFVCTRVISLTFKFTSDEFTHTVYFFAFLRMFFSANWASSLDPSPTSPSRFLIGSSILVLHRSIISREIIIHRPLEVSCEFVETHDR